MASRLGLRLPRKLKHTAEIAQALERLRTLAPYPRPPDSSQARLPRRPGRLLEWPRRPAPAAVTLSHPDDTIHLRRNQHPRLTYYPITVGPGAVRPPDAAGIYLRFVADVSFRRDSADSRSRSDATESVSR
jgi:hypothetical protein